jgi:hypothetical protein
MLLGLALLYVGAVLFLNGLWLLGKIDDKEIVVINVASGLVTLAVSAYWAFNGGADLASVRGSALTLLFTTTYFWVAYNRYATVDGRGLGWFSLFVAITCVPVAARGLGTSQSAADVWLGLCWIGWGVLWFMFFLLLALKKPILRITGMASVAAGILTGWVPGFLLLEGRL